MPRVDRDLILGQCLERERGLERGDPRSCDRSGRVAAPVVAGPGVAALEAALALQALTEDEVSVELVAPEGGVWHAGRSTVTEPFRVRRSETVPAAEARPGPLGARLRRGGLRPSNRSGRVVTLENEGELSYDVLLLALGARPLEAITGRAHVPQPQDSPALLPPLLRTRPQR